ncbi:MAG: hypothetical protein Q8O41_07855 [Candidatus Methanoperedens sp.]|nr:hypothetical protein [Candidatus Methanoperedens sp.]
MNKIILFFVVFMFLVNNASAYTFTNIGGDFKIEYPTGWSYIEEPDGSDQTFTSQTGRAWVRVVVLPSEGMSLDGIVGDRIRYLNSLGIYPFSEKYVTISGVTGKELSIDIHSLREFSTNCIEYAKKTRSSSTFTTTLICFPVAIVNSIDRAISEYIQNEAGHFHQSLVSGGVLEMPVIYDFKSNTLYYFEKTLFYGWAAWGRLRESIQRLLAP